MAVAAEAVPPPLPLDLDDPRSRLLGQFHTSPDSSPPLRSPFLSCSSSSSSEAGSPPKMPRFLWNYIYSLGSKKTHSVKNVSTSQVTQPLNQKKRVHFSLSPSESSSQSSSVGSPTRKYRSRDSRSPSPPSIDPLIQTFVRLLKQGYVPPKKTPQSCLCKSSKTRASTKSVVSSR